MNNLENPNSINGPDFQQNPDKNTILPNQDTFKKKKSYKKFILITFFTLIITTLIIVGGRIIIVNSDNDDSSIYTDIPFLEEKINQVMEKKADNRLISKVGKENFDKLFVYKNMYETHYSSIYRTKVVGVVYDFLPLQKYTSDSEIVVFLDKWTGVLESDYIERVPDCVEDSSWCNFKISKDEAIEIAKKEGLVGKNFDIRVEADNTKTGVTAPLTFPLTLKVFNTCTKKSAYENVGIVIDYRNGDILTKEVASCAEWD